MQELRVVGVRVELPGNQPILLLKETQGERYLPIWIGAVEAAAIAFEQQGVRPARPMTHDLLREVVTRPRRRRSRRCNITEMRDGIYIAELVFGDERVVSARPSDAVALAVRTGAPIFGADDLLDEVGHRDPRRAGGRGREVPRVPRPDLARRTSARGRAPAAPPGQAAPSVAAPHLRQIIGRTAGRPPLEMMSVATRRPAQLTDPLARLTVGEQQRCDT